MNRPPYFAFYPTDFANDFNVEAMSTLQVGAYMLLLCKAWQADPPASLPSDDAVLARFARVELAVWLEIKPGVLGAFKLDAGGRWHSKRLRMEYDKALQLIRAKKRAGEAGAQARWQTHGRGIADALPPHCDRNAIQSQIQSQNLKTEENPPTPPGGDGQDPPEPRTDPGKSNPRQKSKVPVGPPPEGFAEFWVKYPNKADKKAAIRAFANLAPSPELLATMMSALAGQVLWPKWSRDGGQYVPNPATWINNRRWDDEPPLTIPPVAGAGPSKPPLETSMERVMRIAAQIEADKARKAPGAG